GPRTRSHTTPTTSDRALESDRCAPRPRSLASSVGMNPTA
ncbi:unnamed protein product, partial [Pylaiella littoralis]